MENNIFESKFKLNKVKFASKKTKTFYIRLFWKIEKSIVFKQNKCCKLILK